MKQIRRLINWLNQRAVSQLQAELNAERQAHRITKAELAAVERLYETQGNQYNLLRAEHQAFIARIKSSL